MARASADQEERLAARKTKDVDKRAGAKPPKKSRSEGEPRAGSSSQEGSLMTRPHPGQTCIPPRLITDFSEDKANLDEPLPRWSEGIPI
eukprot:3942815-Amphidinium_carterae.2